MKKKVVNIKILHIDDELDFFILTSSIITRIDPNILMEFCSDLDNSINQIISNRYHLIISDYNLNFNLNGFEIYKLAKKNEIWQKIPFIIFSSNIKNNFKSAMFKEGISDVILKTGNPDRVFRDLYQSIFKNLRKSKLTPITKFFKL